jgi:uncharacterized protein YigA (DUF484 family)
MVARDPDRERQIVTLREDPGPRGRRFKELVAYGTENDQISEKVHRSTLALFASPDLRRRSRSLYHSEGGLRRPQVAARLWGKVPEQSYLPELAATSSEIRQYADQLGQPYCGPVAAFESREWFEDGDILQSFAFLPLDRANLRRAGAGQSRSRRFNPGMGAVPDAPCRARERRHGAVPSALLTAWRSRHIPTPRLSLHSTRISPRVRA